MHRLPVFQTFLNGSSDMVAEYTGKEVGYKQSLSGREESELIVMASSGVTSPRYSRPTMIGMPEGQERLDVGVRWRLLTYMLGDQMSPGDTSMRLGFFSAWLSHCAWNSGFQAFLFMFPAWKVEAAWIFMASL